MSSTLPTRNPPPARTATRPVCRPLDAGAWRHHRPHDIPGHEPEVAFVPGPYLLFACLGEAREPDAVDLCHLAGAVALRRDAEHPDAVNPEQLWCGRADTRGINPMCFWQAPLGAVPFGPATCSHFE